MTPEELWATGLRSECGDREPSGAVDAGLGEEPKPEFYGVAVGSLLVINGQRHVVVGVHADGLALAGLRAGLFLDWPRLTELRAEVL